MYSAVVITVLTCLVAVGASPHGPLRFPFEALLGKEFLSSHGITEDSFHELLSLETELASQSAAHLVDAHHYLTCGPLADLKEKRAELLSAESGLAADHVRTVYQSRVRDMGCLLIHAKRSVLEKANVKPVASSAAASRWAYTALPPFLKVRSSVLEYLGSSAAELASKISREGVSLGDRGPRVESMHLQVELSLGAVASRSAHVIASAFMKALETVDTDSISRPMLTAGWEKVVSALEGSKAKKASCGVREAMFKVHESRVIVNDFDSLSEYCAAAIIEVLAAHPSVLSLRVAKTPRTVNFDASAVVQTGSTGSHPYTEAGLTGANQICAVMDTGLDDMSCFFADSSCETDKSTCLTPRDGEVYPDRSKVIQYIPYADSTDYEGGHGSHVTGSVLGSGHLIETYNSDPITNPLENFNGVAADAKVAFQDIGDENGNLGVLNYLSLYSEAFPAAYAAGARVHTNSWGGASSYDSFAGDVDRYTYENPDFLVLVAAGNGGNIYNVPSVGTPGLAKNALTVGSGQVRDNYDDKNFDDATLSYFSSTGPTEEGRIKPDVVAPGSYIHSARAADPTYYMYATEYSYWQFTCTAHSMSGTSMATPITAGTVLLVRQYFEDAAFWATLCGTTYSTCTAGAFTPSGYLVKAAMMHSATPMSRYAAPNDALSVILGSTPDVYQGYGYVTLSNLLPLESINQEWDLFVHDELSISEGQMMTWRVTVPRDGAPLRVTVVWYDVYADMNGNLIHNLDLKIASPNGTEYFGNNNAFGGDDMNPNEQITIDTTLCNATSCDYIISVSGVSVSMADVQTFAIVMTTTGSVSEPVVSFSPAVDFAFSAAQTASMSFSTRDVIVETSKADALAKVASNIKTSFHPAVTASSPSRRLSHVASSSATSSSDEMSMAVDIGAFTLESDNNYFFNKSFYVSNAHTLDKAFFEFSNWVSVDSCPTMTYVTITDPNGNSAVVKDWPWGFASCFFGPYTLGYYSHLATLADYGLSGSGKWSVSFEWMGDASSIDFDVSLTLVMYSPDIEYVSISASFDIALAPLEETSIPFDVNVPSGESECYQLSHVTSSIDFVSDGCNYPTDLLLSVTDSTSRRVDLLSLLMFDWFSDQSGVYNALDLTDSAALLNGGTYTLNAAMGEEACSFFSNTLDLELFFRPTECPASSASDVREISFEEHLSSCYVLVPSWVGDGWCDFDTLYGWYNSPGCNYDGGDCCAGSCVDGDFECGVNGYDCIDPEYACTVSNPEYIGDGWCDGGEYNSATCDYDGGDCCKESCDPDAEYDCGKNAPYDCVDPEYAGGFSDYYSYDGMGSGGEFSFDFHFSFALSGTGDSGGEYSFVYSDGLSCDVNSPDWIGDGWCDDVEGGYNTEACGYDGGDCCEESCNPNAEYECGENAPYDCVDPAYICIVDSPDYVGDGWCDGGEYNTAACGYDGGDCCKESCDPDAEYDCGKNAPYDCVDPEYAGGFSDYYSYDGMGSDDFHFSFAYSGEVLGASISSQYEYSGEVSTAPTEVRFLVECSSAAGNGYCDADNGLNSAECSWDHGDCCEQSCVDGEYECGSNGFDCRDPAYTASAVAVDFSSTYVPFSALAFSIDMQFSGDFDLSGGDVVFSDGGGGMSDDFAFSGDSDMSGDFAFSGNMPFSGGDVVFSDGGGGMSGGFAFSGDFDMSGDFAFSGNMPFSGGDVVFSDGSSGGDDDGDDSSSAYSGDYSDDAADDDGDDSSSAYSADYSFYLSAVAVIDQFEHDGALESLSVNLDATTLSSSVLGYLLAVVVIDPYQRVLQIGGYDKAVYDVNSLIMDWPQNWLSSESDSLVATRDVSAAGLSSEAPVEERRNLVEKQRLPLRAADVRKFGRKSDIVARKTERVTVAEDDDDVTTRVWSVLLLFGYDYVYLPEIDYSGVVTLGFQAAPTLMPTPEPTLKPTVKPTVKPTRGPTRSPTRTPTRAPTKSNIGTYIEFNTTIELDAVNCASYILDLIAQESCRLSTLQSLNPNMESDEVLPGIIDACLSRRRGLQAAVNNVQVRRGLTEGLLVEFTTVANINNLGMTDPTEAYNSMVASLTDSITSGDFTVLLQETSASMNSTTLESVSVSQVPVFSNYSIAEVDASGDSSSSSEEGATTGAIVGGVIGGIVLIAIVFGSVYYFFFRHPSSLEEVYNEKQGAMAYESNSNSSSTSGTHRSTIGSPINSGGKGVSKRGSVQGSGSKEMDAGANVTFENPIFAATAEPAPHTQKKADDYGGL